MSGDWMIIKNLKDMELKISGIWNKNPLINPNESHIVHRPMQIFGIVGILLGSGSRTEDSGLRRRIPKGLGLSLCAVPS
jgi:hypothetical protein